MRPVVSNIRKRKQSISVFRGINRSVNTSMSRVSSKNSSLFMEFKDTKNVSLDDYPAVRTRNKRMRMLKSTDLCSNILASDEGIIRYESDGFLHLGKRAVEIVVDNSKRNKRKLVDFGNRLIILPDKLVVNKSDLSVTRMENLRISGSALSAESFDGYTLKKVAMNTSVAPSGRNFANINADGVVTILPKEITDKELQKKGESGLEEFFGKFSVGDTLEMMAEVSSLYMVTQIESGHTEYFGDRIVTFTQIYSTYTKISRPGIGEGFKVDDWVKITSADCDVLNSSFKILERDNDSIVINCEISKSLNATGYISVKRSLPADMDFMITSQNRLWGCNSENNMIYASRLGDPTNWQAYGDGIASDSYWVEVASEGDFSGAVEYSGAVVFFKENAVHRIYGSKPTNYSLSTYLDYGVKKGSEGSVCVVNDILMYLSPLGVCKYVPGNEAVVISKDAFGDKKYTKGYASKHKEKYVICLEGDEGSEVMVYDTVCSQWIKEDEEHFDTAVNYRGVMYYSYFGSAYLALFEEGDGNLLEIEAKEDESKELLRENEVEFELLSGDLYASYAEHKYIQKIEVITEVEEGELSVFVSKDFKPFEKIFTKYASLKSGFNIPLYPGRCQSFRIKLCGKGKVYLYDITITTEEGSENRGRI